MIVLFLISVSFARHSCGDVKHNFCLHIKKRRLRQFGFAECRLLYVSHLRIYTQDEVILRKRWEYVVIAQNTGEVARD